MNDQATAPETENNAGKSGLYMAIELSRKKWKVAFSDGQVARGRLVTMDAKDWNRLKPEIEKAKSRFGLEATAPVRSCYEAGREGFWVHRALSERGIVNVVVDAASIEVNRRSRRAKTDRMDAEKLVRQLIRYWGGEHSVWSVVRVPSEEAEDARQRHRDMEILKREQNSHRSRIESLLFTQGIDVKVDGKFLKRLEELRCWNGQPLPEHLKARLAREYQRLMVAKADQAKLRKQQREELKTSKTPAIEKVRLLKQLSAIGMTSSWTFVMEFFGWRKFDNRRQVAGALGMTPMPYQSGDSSREQGISRSGNRRVRAMAIEIAWSWLRFQPQSQLSRWYQSRFGGGGPRMRRIGIVALARRLMIGLWRYLEWGVVPEGARLKAAAAAA
jgi:transposase